MQTLGLLGEVFKSLALGLSTLLSKQTGSRPRSFGLAEDTPFPHLWLPESKHNWRNRAQMPPRSRIEPQPSLALDSEYVSCYESSRIHCPFFNILCCFSLMTMGGQTLPGAMEMQKGRRSRGVVRALGILDSDFEEGTWPEEQGSVWVCEEQRDRGRAGPANMCERTSLPIRRLQKHHIFKDTLRHVKNLQSLLEQKLIRIRKHPVWPTEGSSEELYKRNNF